MYGCRKPLFFEKRFSRASCKRVDQMPEETELEHLYTGAESNPSLRNASAELAVSALIGDFQI